MDKKELINKAESYSDKVFLQRAYLAGFIAACNIVNEKINTCYNEEFCDEMEKLAELIYLDI